MIGFIGFGRMGGALAEGAVAAKSVQPSQIIAYDSDPRMRLKAKKLGARWGADAATVVSKADLIFLCVKPQVMDAAVGEFRGAAGLMKKCFVSIAAGIPIARLQRMLGAGVPVFRVMPNTPALLRAGMSAVSRGRSASAGQEKRVSKILSAVGKVVSAPERFMDAVTAVSGSGPAYIFYFAEALAAAAQKAGLPKTLSEALARQTIYGAGLMLAKRAEPAPELRRQVTSPGGTTAAAVAVLERLNFKKIIEDAVASAAERSAELAKS